MRFSRHPSPRSSAAIVAIFVLAGALAAQASELRRLEFLGEATIPKNLEIDGTPVGGLSALAWDAEKEVFYALADDPSTRAAARFYTLGIDLADGRLEDGDAVVKGVTRLSDLDGEPFAPGSLDPEGLTLGAGGSLFVSSEGQARDGVPPFVAELGADGRVRRFLPLAKKFLPRQTRLRRRASGVRHNMAFESLTLSPDGQWLFTATENALVQDGPEATTTGRSPVRLLRYRAATGEVAAEHLYWAEAVAQPADPAAGDIFEVAGLVELLALDNDTLLSLERSYSSGAGNTIRLFGVELEGASDVSRVRRLGERPDLRAVRKTLLLDLAELGIGLDNLEGLTLGPTLADGRRTLLLVSDDNFNPEYQKSQLLAFAWSDEATSIAEIQGDGHRSPLVGTWIFGLPATVTAVAPGREGTGTVWVQDGAGGTAPAGLHVSTHDVGSLAPGDRVEVWGRVEESGRSDALTTTGLVGGRLEVVARAAGLPAPVRLGTGGRPIPTDRIDDDGSRRFAPAVDAMDFFESLEGRFVEIADAVVVGPGNWFGDCVVIADGGAGSRPRTKAGGIRLTVSDSNPERIVVSGRPIEERCRADVGSRFSQPLRGVLHYEFGVYRVLLTESLPDTAGAARSPRSTGLRGDVDHLTVASFNVENLDPADSKLAKVAQVIAGPLGGPDIIGLQEVQDGSGSEDDGTVTGDPTFEALIEAIVASGGPRYEFRQIDPADGMDGGRPGGNIRVGYLINPRRVGLPDREDPGAGTEIQVQADDHGPLFSPNPGRVAPTDPAFLFDQELGYEATRKPLALEVEFNGRRVFLINAHLKSKRGDDGLFGPRQPALFGTEEQRSMQAGRLRALTDEILAHDENAAVIVLGDFNDHEFRGPLAVLSSGSLTNLIERVPAEDRYTFNYQGNSQVLDHLLVSPSLAADAEIEILHLHADFSAPRASDHDPVLARLRVTAPRTD